MCIRDSHIIEAAYKAMRDGKNGYAPSPGIPEALEAIRGEAARKGITTCLLYTSQKAQIDRAE